MGFLQRYFRYQNVATHIERHRQQRDQLVAELAEVDERIAWDRLSDELSDRHEAAQWQKQADALRRSIDRLDLEILRLSLEQL